MEIEDVAIVQKHGDDDEVGKDVIVQLVIENIQGVGD